MPFCRRRMTESGTATRQPSAASFARHPDAAAVDATRREREDPVVALVEHVEVGGRRGGWDGGEDESGVVVGWVHADVDVELARVVDGHARHGVGIAERVRHRRAHEHADDDQRDDRDGWEGATRRVRPRHRGLRHGALSGGARRGTGRASEVDGGGHHGRRARAPGRAGASVQCARRAFTREPPPAAQCEDECDAERSGDVAAGVVVAAELIAHHATLALRVQRRRRSRRGPARWPSRRRRSPRAPRCRSRRRWRWRGQRPGTVGGPGGAPLQSYRCGGGRIVSSPTTPVVALCSS